MRNNVLLCNLLDISLTTVSLLANKYMTWKVRWGYVTLKAQLGRMKLKYVNLLRHNHHLSLYEAPLLGTIRASAVARSRAVCVGTSLQC